MVHNLKKNVFLRIAALLLVSSVFGLCIIPGTVSRYASEFSMDSDTVRAGIFRVNVATAFDAQGEPTGWTNLATGDFGTVTIPLFKTLLNQNSDATHNITNGSPNIVTNRGPIIAPGSGGYLQVVVENLSEVDVLVEVIMGDAASPIPLVWSGGTAGIYTSPPLVAVTGKHTFGTIRWNWAFERGEDPEDTTFGVDQLSYDLPITIRATQID